MRDTFLDEAIGWVGEPSHKQKEIGVSISHTRKIPDTIHFLFRVPIEPVTTLEIELVRHGREIVEVEIEIPAVEFEARRVALHDDLSALWEDRESLIFDDVLARLDPAHVRPFLEKVALNGWQLYQLLFKEGESLAHSAEEQVLHAHLSGDRYTQGQIVSFRYARDDPSDICFPWQLVYPKEPDTELSAELFWGFKYQVEHPAGWTSKNTTLLDARPSIAIAVDHSMDVQLVHSSEDHPFHERDPSCEIKQVCQTEQALVAALKNFPHSIFYFYGHIATAASSSGKRLLDRTSLCMSRFDRVRLDKIKCDYGRATVLVFLNGCHSEPLFMQDDASVLEPFCRAEKARNKTHCIATSFQVPRGLAAEFAKLFWQAFLMEVVPASGCRRALAGRMSAGQALLYARHELLAQYGNPLGLLYSLFGSSDLHCN